MKRKTKRKIRRFWGILFTIYGGVFTLGSLIAAFLIQPLVSHIAKSLQPQVPIPVWVWLIAFWFIVLMTLYFVSKVLFYIYLRSLTPVIEYFEPVNFGKPDKSTILKAIDGILNTKKVAPSYVHAAPKCREVEIVKSRLKKTGFAIVSGGPGEGKSMAAYHAAYEFQDKSRYRVYALRAERLENKTEKEIRDEVLFQLDSLKGRKKLIIVDDAHKLAIKEDLNTILQQEAKEEHGKYIWVETEFYEGKKKEIQLGTVQVDFQPFLEVLLRDLYKSADPTLQEALKGRIEELSDAIKRVKKGEIRDAWHFAFIASRGEERLKQEILYLNDLEMQVLFLISVYTVLSGEAELSINYLLDKLNNLKFGWLTEALRKSTFSEAIKSLQEYKQEYKYEPKLNYERKSMIRIYDKNKSDRGYIASLHYNFARAMIGASLLRTNLAEDLLSSVRELLTSEYFKCRYIGVFHRDIESYAADFDRKNKDWLINFINNLLPKWLKCYPHLLTGIKSAAKDVYNKIIENLDVYTIAEKVNRAEVGQFDQLAQLLDAIGDRRDELIGKSDLAQLSRTANRAEVGQFDQLAHLLDAIGDRRDELIEKLDLEQFGIQVSNAKIEQFAQIENLILALGDNKNKLIEKINLKNLAEAANDAKVEEFENLAHLLKAIGDRRDELIEKLDLEQFGIQANNAKIEQFVQIANLLVALGGNRNKSIEKMDLKMLAKTSSGAKVEQFENLAQLLRELEESRNELIEELDFEKLAKAANSAEVNEFKQVAELLKELSQSKSQLSTLLDHDTFVQKANQAGPYDIRGLIMLVAELEEEDRSKYIREVDWSSICLKCPSYVHWLNPLGVSLENLWKQAEISLNRASIEKVTQHLRDHANEIKEEIGKAYPRLYSGVAKFLWNCNQVKPELAKQIATETMSKLAETFRIRPTEYQGTGQLINALYAIDPDLSTSFVKNNMVRGKIQQSINMHDWSEEVEGLKHLIKALYRSVPELWKKMVSYKWLTVDLSSLDLDLIYRDIDEERNAGTAYNTH